MTRCLFLIMPLLLLLPASLKAGEGGKPRVGLVRKILNFIDTMAVSGIDQRYIQIPGRPWAVVVRSTLNQAFISLKSENSTIYPDASRVRLKSYTDLAASAGVWVGYRGYGIGYSQDIIGQRGADFTTNIVANITKNFIIGAMGGHYGVNLRIRTYTADESRLTVWEKNQKDPLMENISLEIGEPISVRSVFADGYYMFNGKHFSYSAAYDQSAIQLRSAGSLVAGLMYHYSRVEFDGERSLDLQKLMNGVEKMKVWQGSLGGGYVYNWVPASHLLMSAMFLPMLTFYNRVKVYYDNKTEPEMTKNHVVPNFDARLSVTYNWERSYVNAFGHYNSFRYDNNDGGSVRLGDWYVYLSWGFRF